VTVPQFVGICRIQAPSVLRCAVFEFPTLEFPFTGVSESEEDGYFARVLGDKAASEINNALARIQPDRILLLGLSEIEQSYLRSRMPEERLMEVTSIAEFLAAFSAIVQEKPRSVASHPR
jgi:hypothetical protein